MRRYDESTGFAMWVSDFETESGYEWCVVGYDPNNHPIEIAGGVEFDQDKAVGLASDIYEYHIDRALEARGF